MLVDDLWEESRANDMTSLLGAGRRRRGSRLANLLVPGTRILISQTGSNGYNLVTETLDVVNGPRSHQLDSTLVGVVLIVSKDRGIAALVNCSERHSRRTARTKLELYSDLREEPCALLP